jgi:hypothetical protein
MESRSGLPATFQAAALVSRGVEPLKVAKQLRLGVTIQGAIEGELL